MPALDKLYLKLFPRERERRGAVQRYRERKIKRRDQLRVDSEKTTNRILTISAEEYAKLNGRNLADYEAFLVKATSDIWFEGQGGSKIAQDDATSMLLSELDAKGLDVAVNVRYQNSRSGGLIIPDACEVTAYGTGLKLKKRP